MSTQKITFKLTTFVSLILAPSLAFAHSGHESTAFSSGLIHPVTGVDHLIMLLAFGLLVGCITATTTQKIVLLVSALTMLMVGLLVGSAFGLATGIEVAIVASLFIVSAAIWQAFSASQKMIKLSLGLCVGMMFFHGYAHGVEVQGALGPFSLGMMVGASVLMALGTTIGHQVASRWISLGVAAVSALFLMAA